MAELSIEFIDEAISKLTNLKNLAASGASLDKLKDQFNGVNDSLSRLKGNVPGLNTLLQKSETILGDIFDIKINETFDNAAISISEMSKKIREGNSELGTFIGTALLLTPRFMNALKVSEGFANITQNVKGSSASLQGLSSTLENSFKGIAPEIAKPLEKVFAYINKFSAAGDFSRNMETSLLRSAAASGDLSRMLGSLGGDFSGLSQKTEQFTRKTADVGTATGLTAGEVAGYAHKLMSIPGSMDALVGAGKDGTSSISMLEATIKVAQGTFQEVGSVIDTVNNMFLQMGTSGDRALETISRMRSASDALRIPLDIVQDLTLEAGKQFKFLGDNSNGAIDILGRLGPALRESGLGPQAIKELTSGVIESIGRMGTAQKAFLAGQTRGMTGGLQGAFQIDLMLKQGKMGDVQKIMEDQLKRQFGGRIVSLEQAASNQASAAQFQKQLSFMTSGPTPIARDEQQAIALLEAMSKGETIKPEQMVKSSKEAFSDVMTNSTKIQERQYNVAVVANNYLEKLVGLQAIASFDKLQKYTGNDSALGKMINIDQKKEDASKSASGSKLITGKGIQGGKDFEQALNDTMADTLDSALGIGTAMRNVANDLIDESKKTNQEFLNSSENKTEEEQDRSQTEIRGRVSIPEPPRRAVMRTITQEEAAENIKPKTAIKETQKVDITLKPVCGNCLKDMPDQNAVLQMIDGRIEVLEGGRATGVASGVYKQK